MNGRKADFSNLKKVMPFTLLWYLIAHGYRMSNLLYYHDSLVNATRSDVGYQRSLGRFIQPFVVLFTGSITSAWLISVITILFLGLSIWLICEIFDLKETKEIGFVSAIFVCNNVITSANFAYIPWLDVYAMALFFAVLGFMLLRKGKLLYYLLGIASIIVSLGLYQAYICVGLTLIVIVCIRELYKGEEPGKLIKKEWKTPVGFLAAGIIYYVIYKAVLFIHHIDESTGYNGLGNLGSFGGKSIFSMIGTTYAKFFELLSGVGVYSSGSIGNLQIQDILKLLVLIINIFAMALVVLGIFRINLLKKTGLLSIVLQAVLLLLFPFAADFVCFLSKGMVYYLMVYAFLLLYIFAAIVIKDNITIKESAEANSFNVKQLLLVPVLWLVLNNVVFSNQVYVKLHLSEEAAHSIMTRIVADIEKTDGYLWGQTPVVFIGNFDEAKYVPRDEYFDRIESSVLPFTGKSAFFPYFIYHLGANINVQEIPDSEKLGADMPCFPEEGYIKFQDGILAVKLSD